MNITEDETEVAQVLEDGLQSGQIAIPGDQKSNPVVFKDISAFTQYLHTLNFAN